jgi:hypothetical protein
MSTKLMLLVYRLSGVSCEDLAILPPPPVWFPYAACMTNPGFWQMHRAGEPVKALYAFQT